MHRGGALPSVRASGCQEGTPFGRRPLHRSFLLGYKKQAPPRGRPCQCVLWPSPMLVITNQFGFQPGLASYAVPTYQQGAIRARRPLADRCRARRRACRPRRQTRAHSMVDTQSDLLVYDFPMWHSPHVAHPMWHPPHVAPPMWPSLCGGIWTDSAT